MTPEDLQEKKDGFLVDNNNPRTDAVALTSGLNAAVQHNVLYAQNLSQAKRRAIRDAWGRFLSSVLAKYESPVSGSEYEQDVERLKQMMNTCFSDYFRSDGLRPGCAPGFRISHAQKSLSVFLKHMWCMGKIATPPQCPIDRKILREVGLMGTVTPWTYVNKIEEHHHMIELLTERAGTDGLAGWELVTFSEVQRT
jgi:hypothetical protein